jgi:hypothetical protein
MGRYNDELKNAGVLLGRRLQFSEGNHTVIDAPFPKPRQVIAGSWILRAPVHERTPP